MSCATETSNFRFTLETKYRAHEIINGFLLLLLLFFCYDYFRCGEGGGDYLELYLHLDDGPGVNERTRSNGRLCSLPKRPRNAPVRFYSSKSSLVVAFHTSGRQPSLASGSRKNSSSSSEYAVTTKSTGPTTPAPLGFTGTYRFVRRSNYIIYVLLTSKVCPCVPSPLFPLSSERTDGRTDVLFPFSLFSLSLSSFDMRKKSMSCVYNCNCGTRVTIDHHQRSSLLLLCQDHSLV